MRFLDGVVVVVVIVVVLFGVVVVVAALFGVVVVVVDGTFTPIRWRANRINDGNHLICQMI